jgi:nitrogen fixation protein NifU and related proteins
MGASIVEETAGALHPQPEPVSPQFLDHSLHPRNLGIVPGANGHAVGVGSCGDSVELALRLQGDVIAEIGHIPRGCAYTVACASAVTALAKGRTVDETLLLQPEDVERELGGLPEDHHHCARLAVNTLGEAIADAYRTVAGSGKSKE